MRYSLCAVLLAAAVPAAGQSWQTITQSRRTAGEDHLRVHVEHAAGDLRIRPGARGQLYRVSMRYDEDVFTPSVQYSSSRSALMVDVDARNRHHDNIDWDHEHQTLDLSLAPGVPLDLEVTFGAAQASLDLGGLHVRNLTVETGASESHLAFDSPNSGPCESMELKAGAAEFHATQLGNAACRHINVEAGVGAVLLDFSGDLPDGFNGTVDVNIGLGGLDIRVPEDVGVQIHTQRFLASLDIAGFTRNGRNDFTSPNWNDATRKIRIDVQAVFGSIDVTRIANSSN